MSKRDTVTAQDGGGAGVAVGSLDALGWKCLTRAELYYQHPDGTPKHWKNADGSRNTPDAVVEVPGNLLLNGGGSLLWEYAIGNGSATTSSAKKFLNGTAALGVSTSTSAAAATQTDLQGTTKWYKVMSAGYPTHTTGTASTAMVAVFRSTWTATEANIAWKEWGIFNKVSGAGKAMLNRKVQTLLTKTSAATATLTATITLS